MDVLKAEIERKKQQKREREEMLAKTPGNGQVKTENGEESLQQQPAKKKYVNKGELERIREQQYLQELEQVNYYYSILN